MYTLKCKRAETRKNLPEQKRWFNKLTEEDSDVALVRIFECFLEAAPQKILQISIILSGEDSITGEIVLRFKLLRQTELTNMFSSFFFVVSWTNAEFIELNI